MRFWKVVLLTLLLFFRANSVTQCAAVAKDKGYKYFAIRNGGKCLSGRNLYSGYKEHGELDECFDGEGGHEAMNVYNITGNV